MKYVFLLLLLTGCASTPTRIETQIVKVPITVVCQTPEPIVPTFVTPTIKQEDDIFVKVRAILADNEMYKGYTVELLAALRSCK